MHRDLVPGSPDERLISESTGRSGPAARQRSTLRILFNGERTRSIELDTNSRGNVLNPVEKD